MPPGQEQYPCIPDPCRKTAPDPCRKTANSGASDNQAAICAQKNYKYVPSRCVKTTECIAPQCATGYRPPPGCCMPPGQEYYPCVPDPCYKEPPQCVPEYRPPPGCCMPPGQEQYPCIPEPCRKTAKPTHACTRNKYEFAPSRCALKTNACCTGYRPPQGCCMPPGQEHRPCIPDPCTKTANSDSCLNNTPIYDRMKYEFAPSRCPLKAKECVPGQCGTGYRPPQGCCMPPGQEYRPCIPNSCTKTATSDCCLNNTPIYDRMKYTFAPSRCPLKTNACSTGYRPPPGCCMPPGQEQYPCIPDPCYSQARKTCTEPDVAQAMGYGALMGQRVAPSNCSW